MERPIPGALKLQEILANFLMLTRLSDPPPNESFACCLELLADAPDFFLKKRSQLQQVQN